MQNSRSRLLKEIRELLKSLDSKLDKLLERQVSEDLGLGPRQKQLLKKLAKSNARLKASPRLPQGETRLIEPAHERMVALSLPEPAGRLGGYF